MLACIACMPNVFVEICQIFGSHFGYTLHPWGCGAAAGASLCTPFPLCTGLFFFSKCCFSSTGLPAEITPAATPYSSLAFLAPCTVCLVLRLQWLAQHLFLQHHRLLQSCLSPLNQLSSTSKCRLGVLAVTCLIFCKIYMIYQPDL